MKTDVGIFLGLVLAFSQTAFAASGVYDHSWGVQGIADIKSSGGMAIGPDGHVVTAGVVDAPTKGRFQRDFQFKLSKVKASGELDLAFGSNGIVLYNPADIPWSVQGVRLVIQADHKIVLATFNREEKGTNLPYFYVARFMPNGALDPSFAQGGEFRGCMGPPNKTTFCAPYDLKIDAQGRIVVVGEIGEPKNRNFGIMRLLPNGQLDQSFASRGYARFDVRRYNDYYCNTSDYPSGCALSIAHSFAFDPNGNLVLAGMSSAGVGVPQNSRSVVMRVLPNGQKDAAFANQGILELQLANNPEVSGDETAQKVFIANDGGLSVSGWASNATSTNGYTGSFHFLLKLSAQGAVNQLLKSSETGVRGSHMLAMDSQGRYYTARAIQDPATKVWKNHITRFDSNLQIDLSYGLQGNSAELPSSTYVGLNVDSVQVDAQDRVVALIWRQTNGPGVARLLP